MASITFKNGHLRPLMKWLDVPLHGMQARLRGRFVRTLQDRFQEIEDARIALLKELCDKDEKGEPIMEPGDRYKLSPENLIALNKHHTDMLEESYVIDVLDSNRETLQGVRQLLKESKLEMDSNESQTYDTIMTIWEEADLSRPKK